jgi:hypothetical protein
MAIFNSLENTVELQAQTMVTVILRNGDLRIYNRFVISAETFPGRVAPQVGRPTTIADIITMCNAVASLSAAVLQSVTMSIYHAEDNSLVIPASDGDFEYTAKMLVVSEAGTSFQLRVSGLSTACNGCTWFETNRDSLYMPDGYLARDLVQYTTQRQRAGRTSN